MGLMNNNFYEEEDLPFLGQQYPQGEQLENSNVAVEGQYPISSWSPPVVDNHGISSGNLFDNPDFKILKSIIEQSPSKEEISKRRAEEDQIRTNAMFDNMSAIAAGGQPHPSLELEKFIQDRKQKLKDENLNKYKTLIDTYGTMQNAQLSGEQNRMKVLNTYMDTSPGSPKALANAENFANGLEHYKSLMKQNAAMVGMDPEELKSQLLSIDSYKTNAKKMSYAQQEKLIADLDKKMGQGIGAARNFAMVQQSKSTLDDKKEKEKFDQEMAKKTLALHQMEASGRISHQKTLEEIAKLHAQIAAQQHQDSKATKESDQEEKEWERYNKMINPDSARSIIGNAKNTIGRYKRLEKIMNNPKGMTPQDYNIAAADLAAMVTGGNPTVSATEESKYSTLKGNIADIWQKVKSDPAYINTPGIKEHILENAKEMSKVARDYIKSNIKQATLTHSKLLSKSQENRIKAAKMNAEMMEEKDKVDLAEKALNDPNASEKDKSVAKKIIEHYAGE